MMECFASRVLSYSSQYDNDGWSANQICGHPQVYPEYGDIEGSWATRRYGQEFIEVEFPEELYIRGIQIYETFNAGAVVGIGAWNGSSYVSIYHGAPTVISQSRIFEPQFECISFKSNRLRIDIDCRAAGTWCELDAVKIVGKKYLLPEPPPDSLANDLGKLVNSDNFSDVVFLVEGRKVYAHKAILVVRSEYFNAMFSDSMQESFKNEVELKEVRYDTFISLLEYLYTGEIQCGPTITVDLLKAADMFSMEDLKCKCMNRIPDHLTVDTVFDVLHAVAHSDGLSVIQELCYDFVAKNISTVTKSDAFNSLPKEEILEIVQKTVDKLKLT